MDQRLSKGKNTVSDLCPPFNIFAANPFFEAAVIDTLPGHLYLLLRGTSGLEQAKAANRKFQAKKSGYPGAAEKNSYTSPAVIARQSAR